jgi:hypothetical protein
LISPLSRLTEFGIGTVGPPYSVDIGVAYGDIDLSSSPTGQDTVCKGDIGDQFCATAFLSTLVDKRLD